MLKKKQKTKQNNVLEFKMSEKDKYSPNRGMQVMNHGIERTFFFFSLACHELYSTFRC